MVQMAKGDTHKTGFLTNRGLYEYVITLFELFNAPETFQRLLNLTFADYINEFVTEYLDDILVYYETY